MFFLVSTLLALPSPTFYMKYVITPVLQIFLVGLVMNVTSNDTAFAVYYTN